MSNIINIGGTSGGSGSSVIANPQGAATDTLVKLGIEGTIYDFAGGGSATHNYSTTEQVVGTWIDGKTLYEKTIAVTQGSSETYISLSGLNIDTFFVESAFIQSPSGDITPPIYFVTGADKFMYFYNRTNDRLVIQTSWQGSGYITIRYTKSTT